MKVSALRNLIFFFIIFLIFSEEEAFARNISYKGGWTLLSNYDDDSFSSLIHYTPHRTFSVGYRYEYFRDREWHYNGLQLNYLAKRWNSPDSQANFYVLSSIGNAYSNYEDFDQEKETAGFIGIAADWEDRLFLCLMKIVMSRREVLMSHLPRKRGLVRLLILRSLAGFIHG